MSLGYQKLNTLMAGSPWRPRPGTRDRRRAHRPGRRSEEGLYLNLLKERNCDTIPIGSAKKPCAGHYAEDFWNMQVSGASAEPFFIITH